MSSTNPPPHPHPLFLLKNVRYSHATQYSPGTWNLKPKLTPHTRLATITWHPMFKWHTQSWPLTFYTRTYMWHWVMHTSCECWVIYIHVYNPIFTWHPILTWHMKSAPKIHTTHKISQYDMTPKVHTTYPLSHYHMTPNVHMTHKILTQYSHDTHAWSYPNIQIIHVQKSFPP